MSRSGRIGLSEYTAQRLAELRARRAEAELSDGYGAQPGVVRDPSSTSINASTSTLNSTESMSSTSTSAASSPAKAFADGAPSKFGPGALSTPESKDSEVVSSRTVFDASSASPGTGVGFGASSGIQTARTYAAESVRKPPRPAPTKAPPELDFRGGLSMNGCGTIVADGTSKSAENEEDCIGFANLPEQVHRKAVKRGFDFTLMVVGESGLGKSTLISSMFFNNDLYKDRAVPGAVERLEKTVELEKRYLEIEERGVKLRLTVVDTPGFNDSLDSSQCWKLIEEYIYQQFDQYFKDESGLNRRNIKDNRVHCCLYFISPYGRGLRPIDVQFMLRLHNKVNIVPVVAKADTLTQLELQKIKTRILDEIERYKIRIYELPQLDSDEDEDYIRKDQELKSAVPFAVVGSNAIVEVNGKKVKGRVYPWGIVEVENPIHSDFTKLRQFLVSTHMQDLKDVTRDIHYENFRASYIQEHMTTASDQSDQADGGNVRTEADRLLLQREMELHKMQEMLKKMQAQLAVAKGPEASDMTKIL